MGAPAAWHLAQCNIARLLAPRDDPRVAPFFAALQAVNALADCAPGFVWRLADEAGDATGVAPTPDPLLLVNLSVWTGFEALSGFAYRGGHGAVMAKRRDWFERHEGANLALWWVPAGTIPTIEEGFGRLWMLDRFGPCPQAFTFKAPFAEPGGHGRPAAAAVDAGYKNHV